MWDQNGYVVVKVEQEHIDDSMRRNSSHCATAEAIRVQVAGATHISVDVATIRWSRRGLRYIFLTPRICQAFICDFDQGERDKLQPFVLRMRPAQITKSGQHRRHAPDNAELRGTGLTIAKTQLHIRNDGASALDKPPQRFNPDGSRNLDPDRCDGPPPKRKRVPRRLISSTAHGDVPCVLGGPLPPTSVLSSRREFGLRVLQR